MAWMEEVEGPLWRMILESAKAEFHFMMEISIVVVVRLQTGSRAFLMAAM